MGQGEENRTTTGRILTEADEPTYQESLRVGWALLWRGTGSFIGLLIAMNLLLMSLIPEVTRTGGPLWVALLPLSIATVFSAFLVMPFVVRGLARRSFQGLHIRFIRDHADRPAAKP
ncbi:MAG: hypothetical protein R3B37_13355 [Nitrospira sp.]|nr:hypothetical protein [Nitrospira sp.]